MKQKNCKLKTEIRNLIRSSIRAVEFNEDNTGSVNLNFQNPRGDFVAAAVVKYKQILPAPPVNK